VIRKLAFLLLWLPALAVAQGREFPPQEEAPLTGPYAGVLLGRSEAKNGCVGVIAFGGRQCEDKAFAIGAYGGYRFSRYLGAEIAFTDLGEIEARNQGPATAATQSVSASAFDLTGVGFIPLIGNGALGLSAFAKAGLYYANLDTTVPGRGESSNFGITYSGGLQWDPARRWGVRASWQRWKRVGRDAFLNNNYDVFGVSGLWRF